MSKENQDNGLTEQKKRKKIKQFPGRNEEEERGGKCDYNSWSMVDTVGVEPLS